jgi:hypothetical protein
MVSLLATTVGKVLMITLTVSVLLQPAAFNPVTTYAVSLVGTTV